MSADFGSPAIHTEPSSEDRHVDLGRAAGDPPAGGAATGRRRFLRSWLDTTAWWTEPRPPIAVLAKDAREGEWTLRQWQRHGRWCWVQTAARTGRVWPWLAARQVTDTPPSLWGELPAVRAVADDTLRHWGRRVCYVAANWLSWVWDSATRTAVLTAGLWLGANWANNVALAHYLVPDVVTAAYWWPRFLHLAKLAAPIVTGGAVLLAVAALGVWQSRRSWKRKRNERREEAERIDTPWPRDHSRRRPHQGRGGTYLDDDWFGDDQNDNDFGNEGGD